MSLFKKITDFKHSFFSNHGKNNHVFIIEPNGTRREINRLKHSRIKFKGDNNTIEIYKPCHNLVLNVTVFNNTTIVINQSNYARNISISGFDNNGNQIVFGRDFSSTDVVKISLLRGPGNIIIGDDCMFAYNDVIQMGDGHAIYKRGTKHLLNNNRDIIIGNHVWVGADVLLLKGCEIPNNCIVGVKSVVTKSFSTENVAIAGIPAGVVKTDIDWARKSQY